MHQHCRVGRGAQREMFIKTPIAPGYTIEATLVAAFKAKKDLQLRQFYESKRSRNSI